MSINLSLCIYLSIMLCPSIYLSIHLSFYFKPRKKNVSTHAYIPYHIEIGPKRPRAETTHIPRPKRLPPKLAETTQAETTNETTRNPFTLPMYRKISTYADYLKDIPLSAYIVFFDSCFTCCNTLLMAL